MIDAKEIDTGDPGYEIAMVNLATALLNEFGPLFCVDMIVKLASRTEKGSAVLSKIAH